jgi:signal peptidase II
MVINILKKNLLSFFIVTIIFILDRLSKYIILKLSEPLGELNVSITSFLDFNLLWNDGIAFGLLSFEQNLYYNVVTLVIILVTFIVIWFAHKSKGLEKYCFLMIFGGSIGNIFDRLYYSSVIDFIDININNFHWFIFNVADMFIFLGVIMLLILELLNKNKI